jgi:hypothetical protein
LRSTEYWDMLSIFAFLLKQYRRVNSILIKALLVAILAVLSVIFGGWALTSAFGNVVLIADLRSHPNSTAAKLAASILADLPPPAWPWQVHASIAFIAVLGLVILAILHFHDHNNRRFVAGNAASTSTPAPRLAHLTPPATRSSSAPSVTGTSAAAPGVGTRGVYDILSDVEGLLTLREAIDPKGVRGSAESKLALMNPFGSSNDWHDRETVRQYLRDHHAEVQDAFRIALSQGHPHDQKSDGLVTNGPAKVSDIRLIINYITYLYSGRAV